MLENRKLEIINFLVLKTLLEMKICALIVNSARCIHIRQGTAWSTVMWRN